MFCIFAKFVFDRLPYFISQIEAVDDNETFVLADREIIHQDIFEQIGIGLRTGAAGIHPQQKTAGVGDVVIVFHQIGERINGIEQCDLRFDRLGGVEIALETAVQECSGFDQTLIAVGVAGQVTGVDRGAGDQTDR